MVTYRYQSVPISGYGVEVSEVLGEPIDYRGENCDVPFREGATDGSKKRLFEAIPS